MKFVSSATRAADVPLRTAGSSDRPRSGLPGIPHASSVSLSLRFVLTGIASLLLAIGTLMARPEILATYHYNQVIVAVTHLFTLGWITSVVMGAMYQLVPVALEAKLFSERIGRWQFLLHAIGVAGMIISFWEWNLRQVSQFGCVFGAGVFLFVYNITRTLARIPRWNVVAAAIAASLFWLTATILFGLFLAALKSGLLGTMAPFEPLAQMHAHAHLGVVGIFVMMTVGISYKLVPMFTLSEVQSARRAWGSVILLNVGLAAVFLNVLLQTRWKFVSAFIPAAGLALFGFELLAMVRNRKRGTLDWGMRYFLSAMALLVPVSILGLVLAWPGLPLTAFIGQLENVYGFVALLGVVSFAILGMLYKIIPFLIWYAKYSSEIGRKKVPALAELYSARLQAIGYWCWITGLVATSVATAAGNESAVRWSVALLSASLVVFAMNIVRMMSHLVRPRIEPLCLNASPTRASAI